MRKREASGRQNYLNYSAVSCLSRIITIVGCKTCVTTTSAVSLQVCSGLIRAKNFCILLIFFRTTLMPAVRRYTCHALMSAGFRISRLNLSLSFRKNTEISEYLEAINTHSHIIGMRMNIYFKFSACLNIQFSIDTQFRRKWL